MLNSTQTTRTAFEALHKPRSYLLTMLLGRTGVRTLRQRCAKVPGIQGGNLLKFSRCWNPACPNVELRLYCMKRQHSGNMASLYYLYLLTKTQKVEEFISIT